MSDLRVLMIPHLAHFRHTENGIARVVEAYFKYLPDYGIRLVGVEDAYDIKAVHAGTTMDCDVAHSHGLYWTADYEAQKWEWAANATVVESLRKAREITVPSEWVAETLRRDMRINPHVVGHGIDWEEWQHAEPDEGYVLWNKNRIGDVCNPEPVRRLAEVFHKLPFVSTYNPGGDCSNIRWTGVVEHSEMKRLVQRCHVYLATTKETFGIGILEAMAAGKPVLGFNSGGILEMVRHKVNGYLATDYDDLAQGLAYCLENAETLGEAGREMAKAFTWARACEKVAGVYRLAAQPQPATVTVVIPSYNYKDKVGRAIESVRAQTFRDWECIVVDDGSQDGSDTFLPELVASYGDKRIRSIRQENQGVAWARNNGIAAGTGKYICCLDADDKIAPMFLQRCVDALERDRSLGIAYTSLQWIKPDGSTGVSPWPPQWDFDNQIARKNQVPTCCVYRRDMWKRLGGYRARYCPMGQGSEDAEFWTRCGAYGWRARKVTEEPLFIYSWLSGRTAKEGYHEPDWLAWHPWVRDRLHPLASHARPEKFSHPVRQYDRPGVSVVIPVGPNHERTLIDSLDSLEAQTYRTWEAIVVNDTGRPLDLAAYPYARVLETEGKRGPGYCRNRGTEIARAPLVVYLDADDYLQPGCLEALLGAWDGETWVYPDCYILHPDGRLEPYMVEEWSITQLCHSGVGAVTALYAVDQWRAVGGFDEEGNREDWEFHLRLAAHGFCGTRLPVFGFTYRHATGGRRDEDVRPDVQRLRAKYPEEELKVACSSCGKKRAALASAPKPDGAVLKADAGWPLLEYTGKNRADVMYRGATGRRYRFGNNDLSRRQWVHPDDRAHLMRFRVFQEIRVPDPSPQPVLQSDPAPKAPAPGPAPEPPGIDPRTDPGIAPPVKPKPKPRRK